MTVETATLETSVRLRLFSLFVAGLAFILAGQPARGTGNRFYFLAATPTNYSPRAFPASLYAVDAKGKLQLVRQLVDGSNGVYDVEDLGDNLLAIASPHVVPTQLSIVHKETPTNVDNVAINPEARPLINSLDCLTLLDTNATRPYRLFSLVDRDGLIVKKLSLPLPGDASIDRLSAARPQDYANPLVSGLPGGPEYGFGLFVSREGEQLLLKVGNALTSVSKVPETLFPALPGGKRDISIVAASPSYFIICKGHNAEELAAGNITTTLDFVHDLKSDVWKQLSVPGNYSRQRIFGPWLAVIEQFAHANNPTNPGRSKERSTATADRPNTQAEYAAFQGKDSSIPGLLLLNNLKDGRRIELQTQAEDSEILLVTQAELVLYRVNDSIYQGRIARNSLRDVSLVVQDDDVPEIHWAFIGPE